MRPSSILPVRIRSYIHEGNAVLRKEVSYAPYQKSIEAAYYRGGTSRAVIFQPHHLPTDRARWPSIFRQIMGSGDPFKRQLDGMGAGISSLSKICLVEPYSKRSSSKASASRSGSESELGINAKHEGSERPVDIDYTFVGLGIENTEVDVAGNCGNMSSAIGPYAYNAGLLGPLFYACGDGQVTVTIRNTNTGKIIKSTFEVKARQAVVTGSFKIDGVATPGSKIRLDFQRPYGSKTGKVLPTGKRIDDIKGFRVTCVDGANPAVFIRADDIKVDGTILPEDFNKLPERLDLLEQIRKAAAVAMGIAPNEDLVPRTIPKIGLVSQSTTHPVLSGQTIATRDTDIVVRFLSDTQPHRAIPLTAALTTAVAARIPGTVVEQLLSPEPAMQNLITIGHASGRLRVNATMDAENQTLPVTASVYRTAKRLFEGKIFYNDISPLEEEPGTKYTSGGKHSLGMAFVLESRGKSSKDLYEHDAQEPKQKKSKDSKEVSVAGLEHETEKESWKTVSYRQAEPTAEDLMVTPITRAVVQLRNHLNTMLRDPELITAYHRLPLVQQLSETYERLIHPSLKRKYKSRGTEWHKFAEKLHKRQRPLREQAEKESRREGKYVQGYRRTTKATLGLDKHGFLKNKRGTVDDDEVS